MKIKVTLTAVREIDCKPGDFDTTTYNGMQHVLKESILDNPFAFIDCSDTNLTINVEEIEENIDFEEFDQHPGT